MKKNYPLVIYIALFSVFVAQAKITEPIDKILIEKSKKTMTILCKEKKVKTYNVALGFNPIGHKVKEGDGKTPEGKYHIELKNAKSRFYKALRVSYPNSKDIKNAKKMGVSPGGDIMIHGLGKEFSHLGKHHIQNDWTLGCMAVTDEEIDEIFACTKVGTYIEIIP